MTGPDADEHDDDLESEVFEGDEEEAERFPDSDETEDEESDGSEDESSVPDEDEAEL